QISQQTGTVRVNFDCSNLAVGTVIGNAERLAARGRAAIQNPGSCFGSAGDKGGDQLRGFVLDRDPRGEECLRLPDVSLLDAAGRCQQSSRGQCDSFVTQFRLDVWIAQADCSCWDGL